MGCVREDNGINARYGLDDRSIPKIIMGWRGVQREPCEIRIGDEQSPSEVRSPYQRGN